MKIKEIDYGIACRIGDTIFINKSLREQPILFQAIINHELSHSSNFNSHDILIDLDNKHLNGIKKEYYSWILSNPTSWIEFLPCWKYEGKLVWNPLITSLWIITIGGIWLLNILSKL